MKGTSRRYDGFWRLLPNQNLTAKNNLGNVYLNKERRDEAVASGKYPRCGGNLVLRKGKYGQSYGCSNYPRCNYILNK